MLNCSTPKIPCTFFFRWFSSIYIPSKSSSSSSSIWSSFNGELLLWLIKIYGTPIPIVHNMSCDLNKTGSMIRFWTFIIHFPLDWIVGEYSIVQLCCLHLNVIHDSTNKQTNERIKTKEKTKTHHKLHNKNRHKSIYHYSSRMIKWQERDVILRCSTRWTTVIFDE